MIEIIMDEKLPQLSKMLLPAMATLVRGVRVKHEGISLKRRFQHVPPDLKGIERYLRYMQISNADPLSYMYILAQRAQAAVMLDKTFTIAIPGLVHLENTLYQISDFAISEPFDICTEVSVDAKTEGSFIPTFTVEFYQACHKVVVCKSTYLARRKSLSTIKNHKSDISPEDVRDVVFREVWDLDREIGLQYARVSGDHNPIHKHRLAARLAGFKDPIMHGWYGVSRIVQRIEQVQKCRFHEIRVNFKAPVILPGRQKLELWRDIKGIPIHFALFNMQTGKTSLIGTLL